MEGGEFDTYSISAPNTFFKISPVLVQLTMRFFTIHPLHLGVTDNQQLKWWPDTFCSKLISYILIATIFKNLEHTGTCQSSKFQAQTRP